MSKRVQTCKVSTQDHQVKRTTQSFRSNYKTEFPCLKESRVSPKHAFCEVCHCDFSIAHGGRDDCRRHVNSKKHTEFSCSTQGIRQLPSFFVPREDTKVIKAELLFTRFLVEHNLPIAAADHARPLFKEMFPDSDIASKYACGRTKTTAMVKCMANSTSRDIANILNTVPFALATDGSNDNNDVKLYPTVVRFYHEERGEIVTLLLSLLECDDNTGEGIFKVIDADFKKKGIKWENCLAFGCDNANTMIGSTKGVAAYLKEEQPSIIISRCTCHLLHLAAQKATMQLTEINIETLLVDIFYFLQKSAKRKKNLKLCQAALGQKEHNILKHVSTRWLSMLEALSRILEQWEPLQKFFGVGAKLEDLPKADKSNSRFLALKELMENPAAKLYCLFACSALPIFTKVNLKFQQEAPSVHLLRRELLSLLMDLLARFIKPSALSENAASISTVDLSSRSKQKDDSDLVIGYKARMMLKDTHSNLTPEQIKKFYKSVRNFYKVACEYILKKFPVQNDLLKHAEVADVSIRQEVSFSSVQYFVDLFPHIVGDSDLDKLEAEFASYQVERFDSKLTETHRMDVSWGNISRLKDASGRSKYTVLPRLMLAILTLPHGNAATERIFSMVRKNQTDFRPNLSTETLGALMSQKVKMLTFGEVCHKTQFSAEELRAAKHATVIAVKSQE